MIKCIGETEYISKEILSYHTIDGIYDNLGPKKIRFVYFYFCRVNNGAAIMNEEIQPQTQLSVANFQ